jgi:hypothetical protein
VASSVNRVPPDAPGGDCQGGNLGGGMLACGSGGCVAEIISAQLQIVDTTSPCARW